MGMLAALIIVFREVFEAGLVVGILAAATRNVRHNRLWIAGGVLGGVAGSCLVAAFVAAIAAAFGGSGSELLSAAILGIAVVMLTWHNVWMSRHGRQLALELKAEAEAVASGSRSLLALATVIAITVLREGSEVVMFLFGVAVSKGTTAIGMLGGGAAGLALGALVSVLTYTGLVAIPVRYLFHVLNVLLTLLAAGMAAQAVAFLEQGGLIDMLSATVWNTSAILSDRSLLGSTLHTLVGYSDRPSQMQLLVYAITLATIFFLMRWSAPRPARPRSGAT
jgi:high-affinity iron transporter